MEDYDDIVHYLKIGKVHEHIAKDTRMRSHNFRRKCENNKFRLDDDGKLQKHSKRRLKYLKCLKTEKEI